MSSNVRRNHLPPKHGLEESSLLRRGKEPGFGPVFREHEPTAAELFGRTVSPSTATIRFTSK